jgi:enediyne biosynthesis protein E4
LHNEVGKREKGKGKSAPEHLNTRTPEYPNTGHWLGVRLIGVGSNRDGYGAAVTVLAGGRKLVRYCHTDGSYMSASDPRVHFGLGSAGGVEEITIRWPSGQVDRLTSPPIDRYLILRERQGLVLK